MKWWYLPLGLGLLALLGYGVVSGHAQLVRERPLLPLNFDHRPHGQVNCVTCHHDYADKSVVGSAPTCILCHKQTPELAVRIEEDFHQQCRGCHLQRLQALQPGGPVRACQQCHAPLLLTLPKP